MPFPLSPKAIDTIADIISGGPGMSGGHPPIGLYRSGPELEKFMRYCNIDFQLTGSRVPSLTQLLIDINNSESAEQKLTVILEAAADPRDFINDEERHQNVINTMNDVLKFDDLELRKQGIHVRLVRLGANSHGLEALNQASAIINFDTVQRDLARAQESVATDPEDAITAACSLVESVCRSILIELGIPLPAKRDIKGLYNAVKGPLRLNQNRDDIPAEIADDVRKVLSGLSTIIEGIGALRTHGGDAHGRERGFTQVDSRIATLAVNSSASATLFLIETWQKRFPTKELYRHQPDD